MTKKKMYERVHEGDLRITKRNAGQFTNIEYLDGILTVDGGVDITLPNLITVGNIVMNPSSQLHLPECTAISDRISMGRQSRLIVPKLTNLKTAYLDPKAILLMERCRTIGYLTMESASTVSLPNCLTIESKFQGRDIDIELPRCETIGDIEINDESTMLLPACKEVRNTLHVGERCTAQLPVCTSIKMVVTLKGALVEIPNCTPETAKHAGSTLGDVVYKAAVVPVKPVQAIVINYGALSQFFGANNATAL